MPVFLMPVVMTPSALGKIQRKILPAGVLVGREKHPVQCGPNGLNRIGVDVASHVLPRGVVYGLMWDAEDFTNILIRLMSIGINALEPLPRVPADEGGKLDLGCDQCPPRGIPCLRRAQ